MFSDLRRAARALRRSPSFSLATILTLAVGIGATTAIFTVLYAVLLRPLPVPDSSKLVVLLHEGQFAVSPADYLDYQRDTRSYVSMAAAQVSGVTLTGSGDSLRIDGLQVAANMFDLLGVPAALGRTFVRGEDTAGHDRVVVISDGLWRERFGADPSARRTDDPARRRTARRHRHHAREFPVRAFLGDWRAPVATAVVRAPQQRPVRTIASRVRTPEGRRCRAAGAG